MAPLQDFLNELKATDEKSLVEFCRRKVLHGTPAIFAGREDDYYHFRRRIAEFSRVEFHEIYITGSAKLGFSPFKKREFDFDSDVDVAVVSSIAFQNILESIYDYQMEIRRNRRSISQRERELYHSFLEYTALGWIRPDKLPTSFQIGPLKQGWFDFFKSISYDGSEVGNHKVAGGVFKSYRHLERYTVSGLSELANSLRV